MGCGASSCEPPAEHESPVASSKKKKKKKRGRPDKGSAKSGTDSFDPLCSGKSGVSPSDGEMLPKIATGPPAKKSGKKKPLKKKKKKRQADGGKDRVAPSGGAMECARSPGAPSLDRSSNYVPFTSEPRKFDLLTPLTDFLPAQRIGRVDQWLNQRGPQPALLLSPQKTAKRKSQPSPVPTLDCTSIPSSSIELRKLSVVEFCAMIPDRSCNPSVSSQRVKIDTNESRAVSVDSDN